MSSNKREPWYESDSPNRQAWGMGRIVLAALAVIAVLGIGTWGFKVVTSDVKGAGDTTVQVNSANNRIFAQQQFQTLYNQIIAYDQKLEQAAKDKAGQPADSNAATNYTGLINTCIDARNQYNAAANSITQAKWRDSTLPFQIDDTDPRLDCKEPKTP